MPVQELFHVTTKHKKHVTMDKSYSHWIFPTKIFDIFEKIICQPLEQV